MASIKKLIASRIYSMRFCSSPVKEVLYTANTRVAGGRRSSDGRLDIKFSSLGSAANGTNPKQLFATGWSACFIGAISLNAPNESHAAGRCCGWRGGNLCKTDDDYTVQLRGSRIAWYSKATRDTYRLNF